jgi:endonuclease-8
VAEGDTILRAARRIEAALAGETVSVTSPNPRGRVAGIQGLDGSRLDKVEPRGKHLLLHFGDLVLHSHLGMNGSWRVGRRGAGLGRPARSAWIVLSGERQQAAQFGGPTLRVLPSARLRIDPVISRLGPDILAMAFDPELVARSLRAAPRRALGDALLDQHLVAGIGNVFKSEACFAARLNPWLPIAQLSDEQLCQVVQAARELMQAAAEHGRADRAVYRRKGKPCPRCTTPILSRGQGDANRTTYWCPTCQPTQG